MNNILVLHFGYAEDSKLCSIIAKNDDFDFSSDKVAIESLALDLLAIYKARFLSSYQYKLCCDENLKNKSNRYCSWCGTLLNEGFNRDGFFQWLEELCLLTNDDFGYDYHSGDDLDGRSISWELGISPMDLIIIDKEDINPIEDCAKVFFKVLEDLKLI